MRKPHKAIHRRAKKRDNKVLARRKAVRKTKPSFVVKWGRKTERA